LVIPHSIFKGLVNDIIEENKNKMSSLIQCYELIKKNKIKNQEGWRKVTQKINNKELIYPCDPAKYFFASNKKSTSDSYAVKEAILISSDKPDHYKKHIIGNLDDHKNLIRERSLKSNQTDKTGWGILKDKPHWACGGHPTFYFNVSVDELYIGMEDLLIRGSAKTDFKLNQLRSMFPNGLKRFTSGGRTFYKTINGELIAHEDLSKKIGCTRSTLTAHLKQI
jgi:hypothetical protein